MVVDLLSFSTHHIDVEVTLPGEETKWRFTGFYGVPEEHHRHRSWELLRLLHSRSTLPWVVGDDFNEILMDAEKEWGIGRAPAALQTLEIAFLIAI